MGTPQTQGLQERQAVEKLAHDNQGQGWSKFLQSLNKEASKGQEIPSYYQVVAEQTEEAYNRLPQTVKDSLDQMPPQIVASYFEVCGWVARTAEQQGDQTGQSISHFIASTIEQSTRALSMGQSGSSRR